jgi:hypothetical protein
MAARTNHPANLIGPQDGRPQPVNLLEQAQYGWRRLSVINFRQFGCC